MLLTVLIISGTILSATTIAGLLMLYQIRQATQFGLSVQALFAADTGLEWKLFESFVLDNEEERNDRGADRDHPSPCNSFNSASMANCTTTGDLTTSLNSVGCAGAELPELERQGLCPRPVSRAFELEFR